MPVEEKQPVAVPASWMHKENADPNEPQGAAVDKIRDLLLGTQIRNYDQRFARLEDTLAREAAEMKESVRRRFESLEAAFKKETETLAARLKSERE